MLNYFPREVNLTNFKDIIEEMFIEIGTTEILPNSLERIAQKLGKEFDPNSLPRVNVTERDTVLPASCGDIFAEAHPLEYAIYEYVKSGLHDR